MTPFLNYHLQNRYHVSEFRCIFVPKDKNRSLLSRPRYLETHGVRHCKGNTTSKAILQTENYAAFGGSFSISLDSIACLRSNRRRRVTFVAQAPHARQAITTASPHTKTCFMFDKHRKQARSLYQTGYHRRDVTSKPSADIRPIVFSENILGAGLRHSGF